MKRNLITLAGCVLILFINACKKDISRPTTSPKTISSPTPVPDGYTLTMVGLLPNSNVTVIETGYKLSFENGHAYKVNIASGARVRDLGEVMPRIGNGNSATNSIAPRGKILTPPRPNLILGNGSGSTFNWITYSQWQNTTANPITTFTTTWTIPNAPASFDNQVFAIWMGLMPTDTTYPSYTGQQLPLIQPALIWGYFGGVIGGGNYWTAVSYMLWTNTAGETLAAISTVKNNVAPGTVLQAQISCTGPTNGSYTCTSQFVGLTGLVITEGDPLNVNSGGTAPAPLIPALNYAAEVLEIPGQPYITSVNEYPSDPSYVIMKSIDITTGLGSNATNPTVAWESSSADNLANGAALGEYTNIISNNSSGSGQVNIYFGPQPPVISYTTPDVYVTNTTISPLTPTVNNGGLTVTYSISPALPSGLVFNTTTGVISGTPISISAATNYTVTATNAAGSTKTTVNVTVNPQPTVSISYYIESSNSAIDDFILTVSDGYNSGPRGVSQSNPITISGTGSASGTSKVTMTFSFGPMPTSATLYGAGAPINGVISGSTITFSGAILTTAGQTATININ